MTRHSLITITASGIAGLALLMIAVPATASSVKEKYLALMPEIAFKQTVENSERYADYLLGFCFEKIRGVPLRKHDTNYEQWTPLGSAQTTNDLQLYDPQVSPDTFTILDLHSSNKSCWTQHDTVAAPLSMQPILDELLMQPDNILTTINKESGDGFEQRTYLYSPEDNRKPVIIYLHMTYSGSQNRIVGIIKEVSITYKNDE